MRLPHVRVFHKFLYLVPWPDARLRMPSVPLIPIWPTANDNAMAWSLR